MYHQSTECQLLGYVSGAGNYKVQDIVTHQVFVSHDVVFEEGQPHRTLTSVGEQIPLFDNTPLADIEVPAINNQTDNPTNQPINDQPVTPLNHANPHECPSHPKQVFTLTNIRDVRPLERIKDRTGPPMENIPKDLLP